MSKYNDFAKKQNALFIEARTIYNDAYNKVIEAEKEYHDAMHLQPFQEKRIGDNERIRTQARYKLENAKADFDQVKNTVWKDYNAEVERLTAQLDKQLRKDNIADPDQLDEAAVKLIDSGVLTTDDFRAMVEKYDNAPAMLRYIAKAATVTADNTDDRGQRAELLAIARNAGDGKSEVRRQWDNLIQAATIYSGQNHTKTDPAVVASLANKWDQPESGIQESIANF